MGATICSGIEKLELKIQPEIGYWDSEMEQPSDIANCMWDKNLSSENPSSDNHKEAESNSFEDSGASKRTKCTPASSSRWQSANTDISSRNGNSASENTPLDILMRNSQRVMDSRSRISFKQHYPDAVPLNHESPLKVRLSKTAPSESSSMCFSKLGEVSDCSTSESNTFSMTKLTSIQSIAPQQIHLNNIDAEKDTSPSVQQVEESVVKSSSGDDSPQPTKPPFNFDPAWKEVVKRLITLGPDDTWKKYVGLIERRKIDLSTLCSLSSVDLINLGFGKTHAEIIRAELSLMNTCQKIDIPVSNDSCNCKHDYLWLYQTQSSGDCDNRSLGTKELETQLKEAKLEICNIKKLCEELEEEKISLTNQLMVANGDYQTQTQQVKILQEDLDQSVEEVDNLERLLKESQTDRAELWEDLEVERQSSNERRELIAKLKKNYYLELNKLRSLIPKESFEKYISQKPTSRVRMSMDWKGSDSPYLRSEDFQFPSLNALPALKARKSRDIDSSEDEGLGNADDWFRSQNLVDSVFNSAMSVNLPSSGGLGAKEPCQQQRNLGLNVDDPCSNTEKTATNDDDLGSQGSLDNIGLTRNPTNYDYPKLDNDQGTEVTRKTWGVSMGGLDHDFQAASPSRSNRKVDWSALEEDIGPAAGSSPTSSDSSAKELKENLLTFPLLTMLNSQTLASLTRASYTEDSLENNELTNFTIGPSAANNKLQYKNYFGSPRGSLRSSPQKHRSVPLSREGSGFTPARSCHRRQLSLKGVNISRHSSRKRTHRRIRSASFSGSIRRPLLSKISRIHSRKTFHESKGASREKIGPDLNNAIRMKVARLVQICLKNVSVNDKVGWNDFKSVLGRQFPVSQGSLWSVFEACGASKGEKISLSHLLERIRLDNSNTFMMFRLAFSSHKPDTCVDSNRWALLFSPEKEQKVANHMLRQASDAFPSAFPSTNSSDPYLGQLPALPVPKPSSSDEENASNEEDTPSPRDFRKPSCPLNESYPYIYSTETEIIDGGSECGKSDPDFVNALTWTNTLLGEKPTE